jgi:hypothetical protein
MSSCRTKGFYGYASVFEIAENSRPQFGAAARTSPGLIEAKSCGPCGPRRFRPCAKAGRACSDQATP